MYNHILKDSDSGDQGSDPGYHNFTSASDDFDFSALAEKAITVWNCLQLEGEVEENVEKKIDKPEKLMSTFPKVFLPSSILKCYKVVPVKHKSLYFTSSVHRHRSISCRHYV